MSCFSGCPRLTEKLSTEVVEKEGLLVRIQIGASSLEISAESLKNVGLPHEAVSLLLDVSRRS